ncbi:PocR ligand-binding domain-containing protein [uncultured Lutibacter sp.]|uniref:PocR ligand-binding domain-containing protein n=1 Tax=uncultured Lutibacter sp. TaxID=437739 RepID=UPI00261D1E8A|nr:PocR ligand-binding domain-containing protein [uncultured Lutibacter sp.]
MNYKLQDFIDSDRINILLDLFHKTTGFLTAILDLEGNVLSKSGWREICTDFHRVNPKTCKKCIISDTILSGQMAKGEKYHSYECLNGLVDVAVPIIIDGEHLGNLFTGQFLYKEPDLDFFRNQAMESGFNEEAYMNALQKVPIVSEEDAKNAMDFMLNMTLQFCDITKQKMERKKTEEELSNYRENLEEMIKDRTIELEEKNKKLDKMNKIFVGRELRMAELKKEIEKLKDKIKS